MEWSSDTIRAVASAALGTGELEKALVYWDTRRRKRGETIRAGPLSISMPFDGFVVFADLAPAANWGHPCLYLLVDEATSRTEAVRASFPPHKGEVPDSTVIVLRYGEKPLQERDLPIFNHQDEGETS